eukprot:Rhum_TRINITY_DN4039_c0_g1::Rhum_TRINITY_DN4039_c0_g1_i1::g.12784::m.12784
MPDASVNGAALETSGLHRLRTKGWWLCAYLSISKLLQHDAEGPGPQKVHQQGLLRVKTVLSLVEDDGLRSIDHLRRLLHAAGGRQAVHEDGVGVRQRHQLGGDLVRHECSNPLLLLLRVDAVRHPRVAVHDVDSLDGGLDRREADDLHSRLELHLVHLLPHALLDGSLASHAEVDAHAGAEAHQVVRHVVLEVTEVRHRLALPVVAELFRDGKEVRQHLHRVRVVVQGVDHRDVADSREAVGGVPRHHAAGDALHHPRQHLARVLNGLLLAERAVGDGVEDAVASHLVHASLEAHARAQGRLLEQHENGVTLQRLVVPVTIPLHRGRELRDVQNLLLRQIGDLEHVVGRLAIPELLVNREVRRHSSKKKGSNGINEVQIL